MCAGDLCGYQSRRSAKSQILESRRPERKRDLEALPANSPGSCGSESIGVQEILSVPPTLEVPWALSHPRLAKKAAWVLCIGRSPQSSVHGNLEKLQRSTAIPPPKKMHTPKPFSSRPHGSPGGIQTCHKHPGPSAPPPCPALRTLNLPALEAAYCFRPELEQRWRQCGQEVGLRGLRTTLFCREALGQSGLQQARAG